MELINIFLAYVVSGLLAFRYTLLFLLAFIEGPIISVVAGFLSSTGHLNIFVAYLAVLFGDVFGDAMYYLFGYFGRERFVERWGRYFGITLERVRNLEKLFGIHSGKTLLIGKWTHAFGFAVLLSAGIVKMPFKKFIWINFLGSLPKSLVFVLIGYYFGQAYVQIDKYIGYATLSMSLGVFLIVGVYIFVKKLKNKIV